MANVARAQLFQREIDQRADEEFDALQSELEESMGKLYADARRDTYLNPRIIIHAMRTVLDRLEQVAR